MRLTPLLILTALLVALGGCASAEEKAAKARERSYKAEAEIKEERLELIDQYKTCVKNAGTDQVELNECDQYLKAIEALK